MASHSSNVVLETGPNSHDTGAESAPSSGIEVFWARLTPFGYSM